MSRQATAETARRLCSFPGCGKLASSKGLCHSHYCQQLAGKTLTPLVRHRRRGSPPIIEFDEAPCPRADLEGPCHVFRGRKDGRGYGRIVTNGTSLVHKYKWEQANGPVPPGFELDHQCMNKGCCNEKHLRVVTHKVNAMENVVGAGWQINRAKTHCPQGHEYTPENTWVYKSGRHCKACTVIHKQRRRERLRLLKERTQSCSAS